MMNSDLFSHNVQLWAKQQPKKALLLPTKTCDQLSLVGKNNLRREDTGELFYGKSPEEEAQSWFTSLNLSASAVLIVYGVGLGYDYLAAKQWLHEKRDRLLLFMEDELAVLYWFFHTPVAKELLSDPQVKLAHFETVEKSTELLRSLYWDYVKAGVEVSSLRFYAHSKHTHFTELESKIYHDLAMKEILVEEYLEYGAAFFKNFFPNLLKLDRSYLGNALFGHFAKVPAIICGAGPSLAKQIPHLHALRDRALIFSGGAALNALNHANFQPHFGAGIDPNILQLDRLSKNSAFELPFFYRNRMFAKAFDAIHGPRLYITGSGGYDVAEWFEKELGISHEEISEGANVIHFLLEIAYCLGCNPIIFVGMDLAYTGEQTYAPGIDQDVTLKVKSGAKKYDIDQVLIEREDIFGKPVQTVWKWIAEADLTGQWHENRRDADLINITEGGIGFPGVPNLTLKEVKERYLQKSYDLDTRIHAAIQGAALPEVTSEKISAVVTKWRESLLQSQEQLKILIDESLVISKRLEKGEEVPVTHQTGRAALAEVELGDEIAYKYLLDLFNHVINRYLNREQRQLLAEEDETTRACNKLALNRKRLKFLRDVALANQHLLDKALESF